MAAGLGFKDFVTGEVLTAADVDGYLMQGVWVFASAAARDAAVTSPQEGNFAYLKDTNVTTYYTGSAWANLDTTGMTNPMTTTGDTIYSSSGSTPARLGIGSTGQVLTVSGGVPTWAAAGGGSMTQLATGTLSGTSVTLSSIAQTYNTLYLLITGVTGNTSNAQIKLLPNNASTWCGSITQDAAVTSFTNEDIITLSATLRTNANNVFSLVIKNYASTTSYKPITGEGLYVNGGSTVLGFGVTGSLATNTAISSLVINYGGTNTFASGTYILYGVN